MRWLVVASALAACAQPGASPLAAEGEPMLTALAPGSPRTAVADAGLRVTADRPDAVVLDGDWAGAPTHVEVHPGKLPGWEGRIADVDATITDKPRAPAASAAGAAITAQWGAPTKTSDTEAQWTAPFGIVKLGRIDSGYRLTMASRDYLKAQKAAPAAAAVPTPARAPSGRIYGLEVGAPWAAAVAAAPFTVAPGATNAVGEAPAGGWPARWTLTQRDGKLGDLVVQIAGQPQDGGLASAPVLAAAIDALGAPTSIDARAARWTTASLTAELTRAEAWLKDAKAPTVTYDLRVRMLPLPAPGTAPAGELQRKGG